MILEVGLFILRQN